MPTWIYAGIYCQTMPVLVHIAVHANRYRHVLIVSARQLIRLIPQVPSIVKEPPTPQSYVLDTKSRTWSSGATWNNSGIITRTRLMSGSAKYKRQGETRTTCLLWFPTSLALPLPKIKSSTLDMFSRVSSWAGNWGCQRERKKETVSEEAALSCS